MLGSDGVNQFHDCYGFAHTRAAKDAGFTTASHRGDQVDHLHATFELLNRSGLFFETRRNGVNRAAG